MCQQVRKGPLGDVLYPLYYKCSIGTSIIPGAHCNIPCFELQTTLILLNE